MISGAVELYYLPWYVGSYLLKILRLLTCIKKFWTPIIRYQNSFLRSVLIYWTKFLILIQIPDIASRILEAILGWEWLKWTGCKVCFQAKRKCLTTIKFSKWYQNNTILSKIMQSNVSKPTDIIQLLLLIIFYTRSKCELIKLYPTILKW